MQRLVGHQSKPVAAFEVCRSCTLNLSLAALGDRAAAAQQGGSAYTHKQAEEPS